MARVTQILSKNDRQLIDFYLLFFLYLLISFVLLSKGILPSPLYADILHSHSADQPNESIILEQEKQINRIKYKLTNLKNEMELLIKNKKTNELDLKKIENEFKNFKIYEFIPIEFYEKDFEKKLELSLREFHLNLNKIQVLSKSKMKKKPPAFLYSDTPQFKLKENQLTQEIKIKILLSGEPSQLQSWLKKENLSFLFQPLSLPAFPKQTSLPGQKEMNQENQSLEIIGKTWVFRKITFPKITPRNPHTLIKKVKLSPKNLEELKLLASEIDKKTKLALPLYHNQEKFLLESARMSFFLSKIR